MCDITKKGEVKEWRANPVAGIMWVNAWAVLKAGANGNMTDSYYSGGQINTGSGVTGSDVANGDMWASGNHDMRYESWPNSFRVFGRGVTYDGYPRPCSGGVQIIRSFLDNTIPIGDSFMSGGVGNDYSGGLPLKEILIISPGVFRKTYSIPEWRCNHYNIRSIMLHSFHFIFNQPFNLINTQKGVSVVFTMSFSLMMNM